MNCVGMDTSSWTSGSEITRKEWVSRDIEGAVTLPADVLHGADLLCKCVDPVSGSFDQGVHLFGRGMIVYGHQRSRVFGETFV